jgi:hypothetical protein
MFNNFFRKSRRLWDNVEKFVEPGRPNADTEYAIFIASLLQQWLHERATMLHYTYIASLVTDRFYFGAQIYF